MKLILNYEEFPLGELKFNGKYYTYNSFETENNACDKYLEVKFYPLKNSRDIASDNLFPLFNEILQNYLSRPDLVKLAKINEKDSDYVKLQKISHHKTKPRLFYLTEEKE